MLREIKSTQSGERPEAPQIGGTWPMMRLAMSRMLWRPGSASWIRRATTVEADSSEFAVAMVGG